ncbi:hypothetical protein [Brochothrix thermosphacta]|uniref:hypothetical protein n=1 Tax=Brochothrix thermosphacta TaxID=2756 RepID=UPI0039B00ED4
MKDIFNFSFSEDKKERKKEYDELMKDISDSIDYATYTKVFCENELKYCKH